MGDAIPRVLFCDYEGTFRFADVLSKIGYLVDQIRPDGLRHVSVGDHQLYLFSFEGDENMNRALKTVEKLKAAELSTPLLLLNIGPASPSFLNHKTGPFAADAYVANPSSESQLLDMMDKILGTPLPTHLKGTFDTRHTSEKMDELETTVKKLTARIQEMEGELSKTDQALEAQRNFYKPKLKALLEGQKIQIQTETEALKAHLSEIEAKLLDRESKIRDMNSKHKQKLDELIQAHERAQQTLRDFYQNKLRSLGSE